MFGPARRDGAGQATARLGVEGRGLCGTRFGPAGSGMDDTGGIVEQDRPASLATRIVMSILGVAGFASALYVYFTGWWMP